MNRAIDIISVGLLGAAAFTFACGITALNDKQDISALYWLAVGALLLKAAVDLLRPKSSR